MQPSECFGRCLASCSSLSQRFNARLPDIAQVGGVWTPPHARGRGYARCVVAGSLLHARTQGVSRALLFTMESNVAAMRAYEAAQTGMRFEKEDW